MKTVITLSLFILIGLFSYAQTDSGLIQMDSIKKDSVVKPWRLKALYSLNGSQTTFKNWNAGGRTNVSLLGFVSASGNYKLKHLKWDNDVYLSLGGMKFFDPTSHALQKTDDKIDLATNFGHSLDTNYFISFIGGFKTQFLNGYSYPNDSVMVTTFMAPGYINLAIGFVYVPNDNFGIFISPLSSKLTFVKSQRLANLGAFGVEKATYDDNGSLLTLGKQFRSEIGAYFKIKWTKSLAKNIEMKSRLELFSNYKHNPQNIDVNAEIIMTFKVNSWFATSLQWNTIYDDDINIRDSAGKIGPRTQLKSILGLGISYTLKNFKK